MVNLSEVKIISAHEVEPKKIETFHTEINSDRSYSIFRLFGWLYHPTFYKNKISIVALYLNRVIAHAGMIHFYEEFAGPKRKPLGLLILLFYLNFSAMGLGRS